MLTKAHKILLGLLAVQILLTIFVLVRGEDSTPTAESPLLAGFDAAKVTRIKVFANAADAPGVDLVKRNTSWTLASGFDYPVDATKIDALLTPVAKMAAAEPIASSASRHKQLHVADKDYERKVVVTADGKDVTIFIGGPAGLRRNAVRLGGSDDVYAVSGVSSYLAGTDAKAWVKDRYVETSRDDITKVTIQRDTAAFDLEKETPPAPPDAGSGSAPPPPVPLPTAPPTWKATIGGAPLALGAGETLDSDAIDRVVGAVASIALDAPADPKHDASKPAALITITRKTGSPLVIEVVADGDRYWVHDKSQPTAIYVPKTALTAVMELDKDKLIKKPAPPEPAPGAGSGSAATPKTPKTPTPPAKAPGPAKTPSPAPAKSATPVPAPAKAPAPAAPAPAKSPAPKQ